MSNAKIIVFSQQIFNHDNNQLLISGIRKSPFEPQHVGRQIFEHLLDAKIGDHRVVITPKAMNTPRPNRPADLVVPKFLFRNPANLRLHSLVQWKAHRDYNYIGRIIAINGPWLTVQQWPIWVWNLPLRQEIQVLEIRDPLPKDLEQPFSLFELSDPPG